MYLATFKPLRDNKLIGLDGDLTYQLLANDKRVIVDGHNICIENEKGSTKEA